MKESFGFNETLSIRLIGKDGKDKLRGETESMKPTESLKPTGNLKACVMDKQGRLKEEIRLDNVFCTTGKNHVADQLASVHDEAEMSHMAIGNGADAGSDPTALTTETARVALDSRTQKSSPDEKKVEYVATFGAGVGTGTVTEAGIFNAVSSGTLLCYVHFADINKGAGDTLILTWVITCG